MLVSVITPSHNTQYLYEAFGSLCKQSYDNREWIILLNWDAKNEQLEWIDERVRVCRYDGDGNIWDLKYETFNQWRWDILVELDHDDMLTPDCLEKVVKAFKENPDVGFVYSDNAKLWKFTPYNPQHGWKASPYHWEWNDIRHMHSLPITPLNMWYIWFMPDHVRARRTSVYHQVWWHDIKLDILDDQDLIQRTFMETRFYHIPEVLYIYRITWNNTSLNKNRRIQTETVQMYDRRIYELAWRRADINWLEKIDLCWGINKQDGRTSIDLYGWDICADLNKKRPLADWSVWVIRAHDALEHLVDKQHTMSEIHRVLAHGGILLSSTPSTDGRGARQDPTHVSFRNENAFWYWIKDREQKRFIRNEDKLFRESRLYTHFPNQRCKDNNISYVVAHLEKR